VDAALLARNAAELESALVRTPAARAGLDDSAWRAFAAKVLVDAGAGPRRRSTHSTRARDAAIFALAHLLDATRGGRPRQPAGRQLRRQLRNALTVERDRDVEERHLATYIGVRRT
jgi:hypothetical protein